MHYLQLLTQHRVYTYSLFYIAILLSIAFTTIPCIIFTMTVTPIFLMQQFPMLYLYLHYIQCVTYVTINFKLFKI